MFIEQFRWNQASGWEPQLGLRSGKVDLVLYFGSRRLLENAQRYVEMKSAYPDAALVGCSGTRTIVGDFLEDDTIVAVAVQFTKTSIRLAHSRVDDATQSRAAGVAIGEALAAADLAGVLVFADGLRVDGCDMTAGLCQAVGSAPIVIGGMAGDPLEYRSTLVGANCPPQSGSIAAVGLYGTAIRFMHGRANGWDAFGPRRRITRSSGNVLYELDGKPAFELYKRYLGAETAAEMTFPLQIAPPEWPQSTLVRVPLSIDEAGESITFAGHVPENWIARLMRGNADRLILGAAEAGRQASIQDVLDYDEDSLALIVSCAGRHGVMGQRTEEELVVAGAELGRSTTRVGFYSFGEIAPVADSDGSQIHNQTLTITTLAEVLA